MKIFDKIYVYPGKRIVAHKKLSAQKYYFPQIKFLFWWVYYRDANEQLIFFPSISEAMAFFDKEWV